MCNRFQPGSLLLVGRDDTALARWIDAGLLRRLATVPGPPIRRFLDFGQYPTAARSGGSAQRIEEGDARLVRAKGAHDDRAATLARTPHLACPRQVGTGSTSDRGTPAQGDGPDGGEQCAQRDQSPLREGRHRRRDSRDVTRRVVGQIAIALHRRLPRCWSPRARRWRRV